MESPTLISPCVGVICTWMAAGSKKEDRTKYALVSGSGETNGDTGGKARKGKAQNQIVLPAQKEQPFFRHTVSE